VKQSKIEKKGHKRKRDGGGENYVHIAIIMQCKFKRGKELFAKKREI